MLPLPGEKFRPMHTPRLLKEHSIKVSVAENRELVWLKGKEQIEPERLADHIVMPRSRKSSATPRRSIRRGSRAMQWRG